MRKGPDLPTCHCLLPDIHCSPKDIAAD